MIVITGASDGLGLQVAKLYKEAGKRVINISRRESAYAEVNICYSLAEPQNIVTIAKEIEDLDEPMEALINCLGVFSNQSLGEITTEEVSRLMSTNIESIILLVSALHEKIVTDESDIVNVSSTAGINGYKDQAVYGASKWAVRGFSKNLQEEFSGKRNRIVSFCPGGFKSKLFEKATGVAFVHDASWMETESVALALKQTLDLPKNIEISEIVLNRKKIT